MPVTGRTTTTQVRSLGHGRGGCPLSRAVAATVVVPHMDNRRVFSTAQIEEQDVQQNDGIMVSKEDEQQYETKRRRLSEVRRLVRRRPRG